MQTFIEKNKIRIHFSNIFYMFGELDQKRNTVVEFFYFALQWRSQEGTRRTFHTEIGKNCRKGF